MSDQEARFYLDQFSDRLLVIGSSIDPHSQQLRTAEALITLLVAHGAYVVHVHPDEHHHHRPDLLADEQLIELWATLERDHQATLRADPHMLQVGHGQTAASLVRAADIAARLRAYKLVLVTPDAARAHTGGRVDESYISIDIDEPHDGSVELSARALRAGVSSVNVVDIAGLKAELLTYRGAGTLYTSGDHVEVDRVGYGDFEAVRRLIEAGVADGYLKARSDAEIRQLVVNGYGARVDGDHVAGFAALLTEPYAAERAGEVTALTTISRFAGGGVGARLLHHLAVVGDEIGLSSLFAATTSPAAATFFERNGYRVVDEHDVPAAKWRGYDPARRKQLTVLSVDLDHR